MSSLRSLLPGAGGKLPGAADHTEGVGGKTETGHGSCPALKWLRRLIDIYKIPVSVSLLVTAAILATSMMLSQLIPPTGQPRSAYPFARKKPEDADRSLIDCSSCGNENRLWSHAGA